jgi:hypothetical protein
MLCLSVGGTENLSGGAPTQHPPRDFVQPARVQGEFNSPIVQGADVLRGMPFPFADVGFPGATRLRRLPLNHGAGTFEPTPHRHDANLAASAAVRRRDSYAGPVQLRRVLSTHSCLLSRYSGFFHVIRRSAARPPARDRRRAG